MSMLLPFFLWCLFPSHTLTGVPKRYHVPEHIQAHIDYSTPGVKLSPVVKRQSKVKRASHLAHTNPKAKEATADADFHSIAEKVKHLPEDLQHCGYNMTATCIRKMYNIPVPRGAVKGNSLGLYEQGSYFAESDIDLFYENFAPWVPQGTYPIPALIDGANYSVPAYSPWNSGEANIDIDLA